MNLRRRISLIFTSFRSWSYNLNISTRKRKRSSQVCRPSLISKTDLSRSSRIESMSLRWHWTQQRKRPLETSSMSLQTPIKSERMPRRAKNQSHSLSNSSRFSLKSDLKFRGSTRTISELVMSTANPPFLFSM